MKERKQNNFGLKILSVILAVLLWVTIINVIDPQDSDIISGIPVEMLNQETLTSLGYTYEVLEGKTVSIDVEGPTSKIDGLTISDFYASADFSTINPASDYVEIKVRCIKSGISKNDLTITLRNPTVKLNIENRESKTMSVAVNLLGEPAEGFATGNYNISPMSIKITGAESVIDKIATVVAEYNVEGASMDISDTVPLKFYDEEGEPIDTTGLVLSKSEVRLKIPILVKKVVPVNYAYTGTVKEGYKISGITYSVENIVIAGTADQVAAVSSIDLPAELIDITDISEDTTYSNIRITHYVPATVKIISEAVSEVQIKVEPLISQTISVPSDKIVIENANEAYKYSFGKAATSVVYEGLSADIEKLTNAEIVAKVDVSNLGIGTHTVELQLENTGNCTVEGEYTVSVIVSRQ